MVKFKLRTLMIVVAVAAMLSFSQRDEFLNWWTWPGNKFAPLTDRIFNYPYSRSVPEELFEPYMESEMIRVGDSLYARCNYYSSSSGTYLVIDVGNVRIAVEGYFSKSNRKGSAGMITVAGGHPKAQSSSRSPFFSHRVTVDGCTCTFVGLHLEIANADLRIFKTVDENVQLSCCTFAIDGVPKVVVVDASGKIQCVARIPKEFRAWRHPSDVGWRHARDR